MGVGRQTRDTLRRLIDQVVHSPDARSATDAASSGWRIAVVPSTVSLGEDDPTEFSISGLADDLFEQCRRLLETEPEAEHLSPREIDEALWALVCDVGIHPTLYKQLMHYNARADTFLSEILRPHSAFEVLLGIEHLKLSDGAICVRGVTFTEMTPEALMAWGVTSDGPWKSLREELANGTVALVQIRAGSRSKAVDRAEHEVDIALDALRLCIIPFGARVWDDTLLMRRGTAYAVKDSVARAGVGGKLRFAARSIDISGRLKVTFDASVARYENAFDGTIPGPLGSAILRAIRWIGTSVTRENLDDKVVDLCTALECLLTTPSDPRKAEAVAIRTALLATALDRNHEHPLRIYALYLRRNQIVHGSDRDICSDQDYMRLRRVAQEALDGVLALVRANPSITRPSRLIEAIETDESLTQALRWLNMHHPTKWTQDLEFHVGRSLYPELVYLALLREGYVPPPFDGTSGQRATDAI